MEEIPNGKSKLDLEEFRELLKSLCKQPPKPNKRELMVWTGQAGLDLIDLTMRRAALDNLLDISKFNGKDKERIKEMIYSSDQDNLAIAEALIKTNT